MTTQNESMPLVKSESQGLAPADFNAFGSIQSFEQAQRMAKALCTSTIVPETYRGEQNLGNCIIALEIANRIGANVLAVMQNLYIVYGRPAWSSQFLISCVNASRKFSALRYQMTGEKGADTYGCIAWAVDKTGERLESPEITIAIAKAEGWFAKNGSKWKTMPELMLRYRCATLFARLYAPELTMGIATEDEVIDIGVVDTAPVVTEPGVKRPEFSGPPIVPDVLPAKPIAKKTKKAEPKPEPIAEVPATEPKAETAPVVERSFEEVVDGVAPENGPTPEVVALRAAIGAAKIDDDPTVAEKKVVAFCASKKLLHDQCPTPPTLSDILKDKAIKLTEYLKAGGPIVQQIRDVKV